MSVRNTQEALHSPAAERNRAPILAALLDAVPLAGLALEIASGTGQHVAHFAPAMPQWQWLASDPRQEARESITAWWPHGLPALDLDVCAPDWALPDSHRVLDLIFNANMLHISPAQTCAALMQGAGRHLRVGGLLALYGPFIVSDEPTAPSNLAFDASLRERDPQWGLRELVMVVAEANAHGLALRQRVSMQANNLLLFFERTEEVPQA